MKIADSAGVVAFDQPAMKLASQRPKNESNESVTVAPLDTLRNYKDDRSRISCLSKIAHIEQIEGAQR